MLLSFKMRFRKFLNQSIKVSTLLPSRPRGRESTPLPVSCCRQNPACSHNLSFLFSAPAISVLSTLLATVFFSGAFLPLLFYSSCVSNQLTQHRRFHMNDIHGTFAAAVMLVCLLHHACSLMKIGGVRAGVGQHTARQTDRQEDRQILCRQAGRQTYRQAER